LNVLTQTDLGSLPLTFRWLRDDDSILNSGMGYEISKFSPNSEILTINNVTRAMSGLISCSVSNLGGSAVHAAKLLVKGRSATHAFNLKHTSTSTHLHVFNQLHFALQAPISPALERTNSALTILACYLAPLAQALH
jgi:hypothetical protein